MRYSDLPLVHMWVPWNPLMQLSIKVASYVPVSMYATFKNNKKWFYTQTPTHPRMCLNDQPTSVALLKKRIARFAFGIWL